MPLTIEQKKKKTKLKRSQSVMSKINILWSRDGHENPEIESQKEIDLFNLKQLFGASGTADIDYSNMGVDGLIRCYYHISYLLAGVRRNNIIVASTETFPGYCYTERSRLEQAAQWVMAGNAHYASYFVGWKPGEQDNVPAYRNTPPDNLLNDARKGVFDLEDTVFLCNRDLVEKSGVWEYPDNETSGKLIHKLQSAISLIGSPSELGVKIFFIDPPPIEQIASINEILGIRNTDVYPYYFTSGGESGDDQYQYGNNVYDSLGQNIAVPDFHPDPNKWDPNWNTVFSDIRDYIDEIKTFISYTKISAAQPEYFVNTTVIPGRSTNWALQDGWLADLTSIQTAIDDFFIVLNANWPYNSDDTQTDPANKTVLESALLTLKTALTTGLTKATEINNTINAGGNINSSDYGKDFFGDPNDKGQSLWGLRAQWIKSIIDVQDGSKLILESLATVINTMNSNITKAEDQFGLFGIGKGSVDWSQSQAWIGALVTPEISGIDEHQKIDTDINSETFGELVPDGFIVAWEATSHATGYDVWRSYDWDGTNGTWLKLLPQGNTFSIEDLSPANGQVYNYFTDLDVDVTSETKPFYKIKSYDEGGSGDYARIPAESEIGAPKNILDFQGQGGGIPAQLPPGQGGSGGGDEDVASTFWKDPVISTNGLPTTGNDDGDVRLVINEGALYFWDADNSKWRPMSSQNDGDTWKPPVETRSLLPTMNNEDGDVRLVRDENAIYRWNGDDLVWNKISSGGSGGGGESDLSHGDLNDMPDGDGINSDHDSRYYTQNEVDQQMDDVKQQLDLLKYLIPDDAAPLAGILDLDSSRTYQTAYLSNGYSWEQRFEQLQAYQEYDKIIKGGNVILLNPDPEHQFNNADKGLFHLYINDTLADSIDLGAHFEESKRSTGQTYPPHFGTNNLLEITSIMPYNNYGQYQIGDYRVHLTGNELTPGENKIRMEHLVEGEVQNNQDLILFYDSYTGAITFSNLNTTQRNLYSGKYISGIRYYGLGDQLSISFETQKIFNNTYFYPNLVHVDSSDLAIAPYWINHQSPGSTFLDFGTPSLNARLRSEEHKSITVPNHYVVSPNFKVKGYGLLESQEYISPEKNILINTYPNNHSNDKNEYFVDEYYRLPNAAYNSVPAQYKNQWNSTTPLGPGQLLVYDKSAQYPNINFTYNYLPSQTVSYTNLTDTRYYFRAFLDLGIPHTNGNFLIDNLIISDPNVKIHIKLPGVTGWLDLKKNYNMADFTGADENGCLLGNEGYNFRWTSGTYSTAFSGYMIIMRITMLNSSARVVKQISIDW